MARPREGESWRAAPERGFFLGEPGERDFLAAWFQTHRRPRKRAADSAALGFFESVRAGRACTNVQRRDCWKQVNFAAVHVAHGLARSKVEAILPAAKLVASRLNLTIPKGLANSPWRTMPPCVWGAAIEVGFLPNLLVGAALRRPPGTTMRFVQGGRGARTFRR